MASPSPQPDRFARRREKSRAAPIEGAIELFQAKGVGATTLEMICERADVSPRTFFNHFETREHLTEAITEIRARASAERIDAARESGLPLGESLRGLFAEMAGYLVERPAYRDFVGEMLRLRAARGNEMVRSGCLGAAALAFVQAGIERGEFTRAHPPEILADLILGAMNAALSNWCVLEGFDLAGALDAHCTALIQLLEARSPAP